MLASPMNDNTVFQLATFGTCIYSICNHLNGLIQKENIRTPKLLNLINCE